MSKRNIFPQKETRQRFAAMVEQNEPPVSSGDEVQLFDGSDIWNVEVEPLDIPCDEITFE